MSSATNTLVQSSSIANVVQFTKCLSSLTRQPSALTMSSSSSVLQIVSTLSTLLNSISASTTISANDVISAANYSINSQASAQACISNGVWGNYSAVTMQAIFNPESPSQPLSAEAISLLKQKSQQNEAITASITGSLLKKTVIGMNLD